MALEPEELAILNGRLEASEARLEAAILLLIRMSALIDMIYPGALGDGSITSDASPIVADFVKKVDANVADLTARVKQAQQQK